MRKAVIMKDSFFQFTDPRMTVLIFHVNQEFNVEDDTEIKIPTNMTTNISKVADDNFAIVELSIEIGEESSRSPFFCAVKMSANFKWENTDRDINALLSQNAPALLLSYARPIISNVTSSSPFPTFNLPFMDFTENVTEQLKDE